MYTSRLLMIVCLLGSYNIITTNVGCPIAAEAFAPSTSYYHHHHHYPATSQLLLHNQNNKLNLNNNDVYPSTAYIKRSKNVLSTTSVTSITSLSLSNSSKMNDVRSCCAQNHKGSILHRIRNNRLYQRLTKKNTEGNNEYVSTSTMMEKTRIDGSVDNNNNTKNWLLVRRVAIVLCGLFWYYTQQHTNVANAAVINSLAVAAAGTGSASSTTSFFPATTTAAAGATAASVTTIAVNQLTSVAIIVFLLNTFGASLLSIICQSMQQFATWYMIQLHAFPLITKAITAGVIGITGDYMAQWLEYIILERKKNNQQQQEKKKYVDHQYKKESMFPSIFSLLTFQRNFSEAFSIYGNYHVRRGLSILADGVLISGPLMHIGFDMFEKIIPVAGGGSLAALSHVLADSIILDSIFIASTFIMTGIFEGYTHKELIPQFKSDYFPSLKASWVTSIALMPIEFVCFRFLPLSFRVLAVNFIDVIWDAVISFMAHRNRGTVAVAAATATTEIPVPESTAVTIDNSMDYQHSMYPQQKLQPQAVVIM